MTVVSRGVVVAAIVAAVPMTAITVLMLAGATSAPPPGLPDAGGLTRWGLPIMRALHDVAATLTVGLLVLTATALPAVSGSDVQQLQGARRLAVRMAGMSGTVWSLAGAVVLALSYSDVAGAGPLGVSAEQIAYFVRDLDLGRALALSTALAVVVTSGCWLATRLNTAAVLGVLAVAALTPLTVTGHGASNHEAAVNLLGIHLMGATIWVGGLAGLLLIRRAVADGFAVTARRYSTVAGTGFVLVSVSGLAGAVLRIDSWEALQSAYGLLLALKTVALLVLGAAGAWQRRRILPALDRAPRSARLFVRLAAGELLLMAVTIGLAVALSRTSPFALAKVQTAAESLLGYPMPPMLSAQAWVTQWRIDVVWASLSVLMAAWYIAAVVRLRGRGERWPTHRGVFWLIGCLALLWATSAAPAVYGRVLLSMHVVSLMTVALVVPVLWATGRPVTLALRTLPRRGDGSMGAREWLLVVSSSAPVRRLANPEAAAAAYAALLGSYWLSPALTLSLGSNSGRLLSTAAALGAGLFLAASLLATSPAHLTSRRKRLTVIVGLMAFQAVLAVTVMTSTRQLGSDWYLPVQQLWPRAFPSDQALAGELLWGTGMFPLVVVAAVVLQRGAGRRPCPGAPLTDCQPRLRLPTACGSGDMGDTSAIRSGDR